MLKISLIPVFFATYKTAGFKDPFSFGLAKTILLTLAIFAGIAFINNVEGRFAGTYIPTDWMGTCLYSNLLFKLSLNDKFCTFCFE